MLCRKHGVFITRCSVGVIHTLENLGTNNLKWTVSDVHRLCSKEWAAMSKYGTVYGEVGFPFTLDVAGAPFPMRHTLG